MTGRLEMVLRLAVPRADYTQAPQILARSVWTEQTRLTDLQALQAALCGSVFAGPDQACKRFQTGLSGWRAEVLNVSGVGGDRSYNLLQRIADVEMGVLPYEPAYCTVMIGVNDLNGDYTAPQIIANLEQIYRILLDANIGVIAMTVLPVTTWLS